MTRDLKWDNITPKLKGSINIAHDNNDLQQSFQSTDSLFSHLYSFFPWYFLHK